MPKLSQWEREAKRARRALDSIDDLVGRILKSPCPRCGRHTLEIVDPQFETSIVIYCTAALCRWKPSITMARR